jgi:hypothetical protein
MYDYTANYVAGEVNNEGWKKNSSWSKNIFSNSETMNKAPFEFDFELNFEFIDPWGCVKSLTCPAGLFGFLA